MIPNEKFPVVYNMLNESLLELYSRYSLRTNLVVLTMRPDRAIYPIDKKHTFSSYFHKYGDYPEPPYGKNTPFIVDSVEDAYKDDLIKILEVYADTGRKLPLNDRERFDSVFTTQLNTLQIPHHEHYGSVSVEYQAKHPKLTLIERGVEEEFGIDGFLEVPEILYEPLELLVGAKVYIYMGGAENIQRGNTYLGKYEDSCQKLESRDMLNNSMSFSNSQFEKRGWI